MENKVKWNVATTIEKYDTHEDYLEGIVSEIKKIDGNLLLDGGVTDLWNLVIGANNESSTIEYYDNSHSYIGVGDSTSVAVKSQTGLQATTNLWYKKMDASYPSVSGNKVTFKSTFTGTGSNASAEAAFSWQEWTVARGTTTPSGDINTTTAVTNNIHKNLNRKVEEMGTKASAATWVITVEISLT